MTKMATHHHRNHALLSPQAVVMIGALICAGCQPKPVEQNDAAADKATSTPKTAVQAPAQPQDDAKATAARQKDNNTTDDKSAAGGSASIVGGWADAADSCNSGAAVQFNADGTYVSEGETGDWAMEGKTLTVTSILVSDEIAPPSQGPEQSDGDVGDKAVLTIESITEDSARVILSNGAKANWTRC